MITPHFARLLCVLLVFLLVFSVAGFGQTRTYGIDFSPYENGQDPNLGTQISASQILSRMQIIAPYTRWVRSFGSTHGLKNTPAIARQLGLKIAANAWISSDLSANAAEITNLIAAAKAGNIDVAIVGSEAILRNDVTVAQLIAYMNQVRQAIPSNIPVVTADVWGTFIANPSLVSATEQVWANFYPYFEGTSINNAMCSLEQEYRQLANAAGAKTVVVSETGWPSAGGASGAAVPSAANANQFALQFFTWANANNVASYYFESFDEAWKTAEGSQGSHWGLFDVNGVVKPGSDAFFNGQNMAAVCNGSVPGPVGISFTYVPPYGSSDNLEAQVTGVQPANYVIATYIYIGALGTWWTKPTQAQPTVSINPDGTARIAIVTGGIDSQATKIAAFLIPSTVSPPVALGSGLPVIPSAIATVQATRTQSSISGSIADNQGNPIAGATISDPGFGSTTSGPDGKYSFPNISTTGTATLTVSYPNYIFSSSPVSVPITSGNSQVNFSGTPTVDLSITSSVVPTTVSAGSSVTFIAVATDAGFFGSSGANVSITFPSVFTVVSAATTRGSCSVAGSSVACNIGALAPTALASITVNVTAGGAGTYSVSASVSGADPDPNQANNTVSQSIMVERVQSKVGVYRTSSSTVVSFILDTNGDRMIHSGDYIYYNFISPQPGDIPVVGDWNGSGTTKIGVFRHGTWFLDLNGNGVFDAGDIQYTFGGIPGEIPVVGDWTGDGKSKIGVVRPFTTGGQPALWILDINNNGMIDSSDQVFAYGGIAGEVPVVGDWNGDGKTKVGVVRPFSPGGVPAFWILDANNDHVIDAGDQIFAFGGIAGDIPVAGDWNGSGNSKAGVVRPFFPGTPSAFWVLDGNGSAPTILGSSGLIAFAFGGITGDVPLVGKW